DDDGVEVLLGKDVAAGHGDDGRDELARPCRRAEAEARGEGDLGGLLPRGRARDDPGGGDDLRGARGPRDGRAVGGGRREGEVAGDGGEVPEGEGRGVTLEAHVVAGVQRRHGGRVERGVVDLDVAQAPREVAVG